MMSPNKGDLIRLDWNGKAVAIVEYVKDGKVGISRVVKSNLEKDFNELDLKDFQSDRSIALLADRLYPNTKSKFESDMDPDYDECEDEDTITDSITTLKDKLESMRSTSLTRALDDLTTIGDNYNEDFITKLLRVASSTNSIKTVIGELYSSIESNRLSHISTKDKDIIKTSLKALEKDLNKTKSELLQYDPM